jgi:Ca-activated chloride channel family protein
VNEIVTLAVRYGIVTPYISFLVDERQDVLTQSGRNDAAKQVQGTAAPAATSGPRAVQQSQEQNQLRGANVAPAAPTAPAAPRLSDQIPRAPLQYVGDKTFIFRNSTWTDTLFDPSKMTTKKIEFGSDAYLTLIVNNPTWGKYVALGSRVIFVANGTAYEITDSGAGATDPSAAPTAAPTLESRISLAPFQPTTLPAVSNPVGATSEFNVALVVVGGAIGLGVIAAVGVVVLLVARRK